MTEIETAYSRIAALRGLRDMYRDRYAEAESRRTALATEVESMYKTIGDDELDILPQLCRPADPYGEAPFFIGTTAPVWLWMWPLPENNRLWFEELCRDAISRHNGAGRQRFDVDDVLGNPESRIALAKDWEPLIEVLLPIIVEDAGQEGRAGRTACFADRPLLRCSDTKAWGPECLPPTHAKLYERLRKSFGSRHATSPPSPDPTWIILLRLASTEWLIQEQRRRLAEIDECTVEMRRHQDAARLSEVQLAKEEDRAARMLCDPAEGFTAAAVPSQVVGSTNPGPGPTAWKPGRGDLSRELRDILPRLGIEEPTSASSGPLWDRVREMLIDRHPEGINEASVKSALRGGFRLDPKTKKAR